MRKKNICRFCVHFVYDFDDDEDARIFKNHRTMNEWKRDEKSNDNDDAIENRLFKSPA